MSWSAARGTFLAPFAVVVGLMSGSAQAFDLEGFAADIVKRTIEGSINREQSQAPPQRQPQPQPQRPQPQPQPQIYQTPEPVYPRPHIAAPAPQEPVGLNRDRAAVHEAQRRLNALGYDAGPEDGLYGGKTARALTAFQRDQGLPVSGVVTRESLSMLRAEAMSAPERDRRAVPAPSPAADAPAQAVGQAAGPPAAPDMVADTLGVTQIGGRVVLAGRTPPRDLDIDKDALGRLVTLAALHQAPDGIEALGDQALALMQLLTPDQRRALFAQAVEPLSRPAEGNYAGGRSLHDYLAERGWLVDAAGLPRLGVSQFEIRRLHEAFRRDGLPQVMAQAPRSAIPVVVVCQVILGEYDFQAKRFSIDNAGRLCGESRVETLARLPIRVNISVPLDDFIGRIDATPSEAEDLLASLPKTTAGEPYAILAVEGALAGATLLEDRRGGMTTIEWSVPRTAVTLYGDVGLTRPVHVFPGPDALPDAALVTASAAPDEGAVGIDALPPDAVVYIPGGSPSGHRTLGVIRSDPQLPRIQAMVAGPLRGVLEGDGRLKEGFTLRTAPVFDSMSLRGNPTIATATGITKYLRAINLQEVPVYWVDTGRLVRVAPPAGYAPDVTLADGRPLLELPELDGQDSFMTTVAHSPDLQQSDEVVVAMAQMLDACGARQAAGDEFLRRDYTAQIRPKVLEEARRRDMVGKAFAVSTRSNLGEYADGAFPFRSALSFKTQYPSDMLSYRQQSAIDQVVQEECPDLARASLRAPRMRGAQVDIINAEALPRVMRTSEETARALVAEFGNGNRAVTVTVALRAEGATVDASDHFRLTLAAIATHYEMRSGTDGRVIASGSLIGEDGAAGLAGIPSLADERVQRQLVAAAGAPVAPAAAGALDIWRSDAAEPMRLRHLIDHARPQHWGGGETRFLPLAGSTATREREILGEVARTLSLPPSFLHLVGDGLTVDDVEHRFVLVLPADRDSYALPLADSGLSADQPVAASVVLDVGRSFALPDGDKRRLVVLVSRPVSGRVYAREGAQEVAADFAEAAPPRFASITGLPPEWVIVRAARVDGKDPVAAMEQAMGRVGSSRVPQFKDLDRFAWRERAEALVKRADAVEVPEETWLVGEVDLNPYDFAREAFPAKSTSLRLPVNPADDMAVQLAKSARLGKPKGDGVFDLRMPPEEAKAWQRHQDGMRFQVRARAAVDPQSLDYTIHEIHFLPEDADIHLLLPDQIVARSIPQAVAEAAPEAAPPPEETIAAAPPRPPLAILGVALGLDLAAAQQAILDKVEAPRLFVRAAEDVPVTDGQPPWAVLKAAKLIASGDGQQAVTLYHAPLDGGDRVVAVTRTLLFAGGAQPLDTQLGASLQDAYGPPQDSHQDPGRAHWTWRLDTTMPDKSDSRAYARDASCRGTMMSHVGMLGSRLFIHLRDTRRAKGEALTDLAAEHWQPVDGASTDPAPPMMIDPRPLWGDMDCDLTVLTAVPELTPSRTVSALHMVLLNPHLLTRAQAEAETRHRALVAENPSPLKGIDF